MTKPPTPQRTISLWAVIESMQRKLEGEGLDTEVVDLAVTRGLETLLTAPTPARRVPILWFPFGAAKA